MSQFKNTQKLWAFISEDTIKDERGIKSKYSKEAFFKDFRRSYGELYINGILSDPTLLKVKNRINLIKNGADAIQSAAKILEMDPDTIEDVYQKMASIPEIETDSFETAWLDATKLLGLESDSIGIEFRNFCSVRRDILLLKNRPLEKPQEKLTQIKSKLLSIASLPPLDTDQIETLFLDEAANEIFNPLFENKEINELDGESEQNWKFKKNLQKDYLKKFLKLFLHQNFIFSNATILNMLGDKHYVFSNPKKRKIELSYSHDGLFLQESFSIQKGMDSNTHKEFETSGEDFFVKGMAKYRINLHPFNIDGWIAKYELIDSTLECKEKFNAVLDTRNILEKFQDFLMSSLDKIIACLNLDKRVEIKSKLKPLFFVSNKGSSVSKVILDNTESNGNILNIAINSIK